MESPGKADFERYFKTAFINFRKKTFCRGPVSCGCHLNRNKVVVNSQLQYSPISLLLLDFIDSKALLQDLLDLKFNPLNLESMNSAMSKLFPGLRAESLSAELILSEGKLLQYYMLNMDIEELIEQGKVVIPQ